MTKIESPNLSIYQKVLDENKEKDPEMWLTQEELIYQTDLFMKDLTIPNLNPDSTALFYLDKSGRPLAYLTRHLYSLYTQGRRIPPIRFVNIGRHSGADLDISFEGCPDKLREVYGRGINTSGTIIIVDVFRATGKTIQRAMNIFTQGFPEAQVIPKFAYTKVPAWHNNPTYTGVQEYTKLGDAMGKALSHLNTEFGMNFKTVADFFKDDIRINGVRLRERYQELYIGYCDQFKNTPFVKYAHISKEVRQELDLVCSTLSQGLYLD